MKEIKAFVKPFKVNEIFHHLLEAGCPNLMVSLAEGTGNLKTPTPPFQHNSQSLTAGLPKFL